MYRASRYGSLPLVPVDEIADRVAGSLYDPTDGDGDIDEEELYGLLFKVKGKKVLEITGNKKNKGGDEKATSSKSTPSRAKTGAHTKTRPSGENSDSDLDSLEKELGSEEDSSDTDIDSLEKEINSESFGGYDDNNDIYESIGDTVVKKMFGGF